MLSFMHRSRPFTPPGVSSRISTTRRTGPVPVPEPSDGATARDRSPMASAGRSRRLLSSRSHRHAEHRQAVQDVPVQRGQELFQTVPPLSYHLRGTHGSSLTVATSRKPKGAAFFKPPHPRPESVG